MIRFKDLFEIFKMKKIKDKIRYLLKHQDGVTLLELMVSVALFSLAMIITANVFQSIIVSQREAGASQELQENIRFSYEKISKEIRTAKKDMSHSCIPSGNIYWVKSDGTAIQFLNFRGQCFCFYLDGDRFMTSKGGCDDGTESSHESIPVFPQKVKTQKLFFKVIDMSDKQQAIVTFRMHIESNVQGNAKKKVDIQTSLSSRFYE
jgi:prepilin-type N-terminal cleavage/methylation domain-containing protein